MCPRPTFGTWTSTVSGTRRRPSTRRLFSQLGSTSDLLVVRGGLLQLRVRLEVVLNPQLRAGPLHEHFDRLTRGPRLLLVEFEDRQAAERALLRVVIQISRQQ